jgi:hypothetical protein
MRVSDSIDALWFAYLKRFIVQETISLGRMSGFHSTKYCQSNLDGMTFENFVLSPVNNQRWLLSIPLRTKFVYNLCHIYSTKRLQRTVSNGIIGATATFEILLLIRRILQQR